MSMIMETVPFVVKNGSKTAIVVDRTTKSYKMIQMDSKGLRTKVLSAELLEESWSVYTAYPVHKAAMLYYISAMKLSGIDSSILQLRKLIMQYIISDEGKVLAVTHMKGEFAEVPGLKIYDNAKELESLGLSALLQVYNSAVPVGERVKDFNEGLSDAAAQAMRALEKKFNDKIWATKELRVKLTEKGAVIQTKTSRVIEVLINGPATIKQISDASGYDILNARTCIGILRSRKGLEIAYDKTTQLYTLKG